MKSEHLRLGLWALMLFLLYQACTGPIGADKSSRSAPAEPPRDLGASARHVCKEFTSKRLHDPDSADFGNSWEWATVDNNDGTWSVLVKVRATNGFGAKRQSQFTCIARFNGGDSWSLEKLSPM